MLWVESETENEYIFAPQYSRDLSYLDWSCAHALHAEKLLESLAL